MKKVFFSPSGAVNRNLRLVAAFLLFTFYFLLKMSLVSAQYTQLNDFTGTGSYTGAFPQYDQNLISVEGVLYGMTSGGGRKNFGTLFKVMPDGTGYTKLHDFTGGVNGNSPGGSLIYDGTFLYGMTNNGGTKGGGTIFKIKLDGTGFSKLLDFESSVNGSSPRGSLFYDGTFFFGMTSKGGTNNFGTIFKILPDGTGFSKLLDFAGATNGRSPYGSLISDGTFLYGMTYQGGTNNTGTLFKIMPDGTGFAKLIDFAGAANGSNPNGSLVSDGTFLYGMTQGGGTNNMGTLFKIMTDGTEFLKLFDFTGTTNGAFPKGSLVSDGTFLYGMTETGGMYNIGTLFKIMPDGNGFSKLLDFAGEVNGRDPYGSLIYDGTFLYGMTNLGGINLLGTVFKIKPDGTEFNKLVDFVNNANGSYPSGSLVSDGTFLYGMTETGGTSDMGIILKIKPDGTGFSKLLDFTGAANGSSPMGSLISDGTFLYGMTRKGGTNNRGTIFKIMHDGTGFSKLFDFAGTTNGDGPYGALISDGVFLYGMTNSGGTNNFGTIFKIMPDGTGFEKLLDFAGATNGKSPHGSLFSDGTFLYGMTYQGGTNNYGTIFKIMPDGTGFTKLIDFAGAANGKYPMGSLISDGTFLYGMARDGGTNNFGTLFKLMPDGTGFSKLLDFSSTANGENPEGSLIFDGGFLYGMTWSGGINSYGTLFKIKSDGTGFTTLIDFAGETNGRGPLGSLISDGSFLYGMTNMGGSANVGTLFKFNECTLVTANATATSVCEGNSVTLTGGETATSYTWSDGVIDGVGFVPSTGISVYSVTGTGGNSCPNTAEITITVNPLPNVTANATATTVCAGTYITLTGGGTAISYTWSDGVTNGVGFIPSTGATLYTVTGTDENSCSDTATLTVTTNPLPDVTTFLNGAVITANQNGAIYQWLDCNNGNSPIAGATNQNYTATINGDYAVIVTLNSCSDSSICVNVNNTGIVETQNNNQLVVYPNPNNGVFSIKSTGEGTYLIINELGQTIQLFKLNAANKYSVNIENLNKGIYLIVGPNNTRQRVIVTL